ncbi:acyltransferase family protein [Virgibacillus sp. MG-45]|uniref:acyltransferase family protein n=1 Tax=Virgibacillus sp. MG-45 TaxID=3102791 RepID=UPI002ED94E4E
MERNAFFDNAKVILIFLVVFGHIIQPFIADSQGMNTLYMWIYTFHMPAFIFLAGFFAKGSGNGKYILKLAKKLLIPYLIFQIIYTAYYVAIGKSGWEADLFYPHWSLWFLFSLFCWHILLFWFKKIPPLLGMAIAIQIGLIVGYFGQIGHAFSLSRTFVFFPFFLLGFWMTKEHVLWLKHRSVKAVSLVLLATVAVGVYFAPDFNSGWLLASKSYFDLGMPEYGGIARLLVYATSGIMVFSILAWIPTKQMRITSLGTRTMYVYLLHGFFIQYFRQADLFKIGSFIDVVGLAVISAAIVFLLSSKPVLGISQPLIEGSASRIKRFFHKKRANQEVW